MKIKRSGLLKIGLIVFTVAGLWVFKQLTFKAAYTVGEPVDSLNGVYVYYNGDVDNVSSRNVGADNYNIGLKYQCVEFVKRYYYAHLNHRMPDSYGHAKDFYDKRLNDGEKNNRRDLTQYANPSKTKPQTDDLIIFRETTFNAYGHVAIISRVTDDQIEIIQQNPGPHGSSRETFSLARQDDKWLINNKTVLGWLRKE